VLRGHYSVQHDAAVWSASLQINRSCYSALRSVASALQALLSTEHALTNTINLDNCKRAGANRTKLIASHVDAGGGSKKMNLEGPIQGVWGTKSPRSWRLFAVEGLFRCHLWHLGGAWPPCPPPLNPPVYGCLLILRHYHHPLLRRWHAARQ